MNNQKRIIDLTDDNWADHFPFDYPELLVQGLAIGEGGIDRNSTIVTRLLAWVAMQSGKSVDTRYEMSRHDAVIVLELAAGLDATTGVVGSRKGSPSGALP
jgi:hypothetical protein